MLTTLPFTLSQRPATLSDAFVFAKAPFLEQSIRWRLGGLSEDRTQGQAVPYVDGRHIEMRLDEVFGTENWQCSFREADGIVVCRLAIRCEDEWVSKEAIAACSTTERSTHAYSEAFEQAAATWGIGRYLQGLDALWVALTEDGSFAEEPRLPSDAFVFNLPNETQVEQRSGSRLGAERERGYAPAHRGGPTALSSRRIGSRGEIAPTASGAADARSTAGFSSTESASDAMSIGAPEQWAALSQKEQELALILIERIRKGVALASTEDFIVEGNGQSLPEWLREELLKRLAQKVGVQNVSGAAVVAEVATA